MKVSVAEMVLPSLYWSAPMTARKPKTKSKTIQTLLRFVWIISFALAVFGFLTGKSGFAYFLLASLIAAIGAGDISATSNVANAMRVYLGKGK